LFFVFVLKIEENKKKEINQKNERKKEITFKKKFFGRLAQGIDFLDFVA